jgi:glycosyltransferase involved in cell wall biosynthesis
MLTVLSVSYPLATVSPNTAGGAEQVLSTLDRELVRAGHRSIVLAPAGSRCEGLLIPAPTAADNLDEGARIESRRVFKRLLDSTLERYPVDVVHMHGLDFAEYLPASDVPLSITLHLPLSWYDDRALRERPNTTFVCVSHAQARTAMPGIPPLHVVPNGVDLDALRPADRRGDYAITLGRVCPEKAFHLAIDAAEMAGVKLLLAGKVYDYREHREYFETMIRPRLNSRARFAGPIGGKRKARLLAGARCMLIPSQAPETSSLVAMEALACGTPVIAWRSGALADIVRHGRTGFLVSSVEQMADAIGKVSLISRADCRREAEKRFSAKGMAVHYFELYESVISATPTRELQAA